MSQVRTKLGDHWAILGATGTGKTQLIIQMLNQFIRATGGFMPIYILDSKATISRPEKSDFKHLFGKRDGIGIRYTGNSVPPVLRPKGKNFVQVWTPLEDNLDMYDEWFKRIYSEGRPALVLIDELSSITTEQGRGTRYYNILLKQGRGLEISMISLTQSPSYVPQSLLRQAMHVIRFRLNDERDVKKLAPVFGKKVEEEPEHAHGFWYRNVQVPVRKQPPSYYEDMKEFLGL